MIRYMWVYVYPMITYCELDASVCVVSEVVFTVDKTCSFVQWDTTWRRTTPRSLSLRTDFHDNIWHRARGHIHTLFTEQFVITFHDYSTKRAVILICCWKLCNFVPCELYAFRPVWRRIWRCFFLVVLPDVTAEGLQSSVWAHTE